MSKEKGKAAAKESSGNMVYCLGIIGAAVYYIQQADGFFDVILAFLKALVWPAFLVYDLLSYIAV
jgi:hypothetical protein